MKAAHSRSRTTIAVVLCLVLLGVAGLAAINFLQILPNTYIQGFFEHARLLQVQSQGAQLHDSIGVLVVTARGSPGVPESAFRRV